MGKFKPGELVYVWRRPHWRLAIIVGPVAATYTRWMVLVDGERLNYSRTSMHKSEGFKVELAPTRNNNWIQ
jgi:hypothetical protein